MPNSHNLNFNIEAHQNLLNLLKCLSSKKKGEHKTNIILGFPIKYLLMYLKCTLLNVQDTVLYSSIHMNI